MRLDVMEIFFTTIKENCSSHRIQLDMASQSYRIPIPTLILSYESKEPLQEYGLSEIAHQTHQWIYHQLLIPDVLYSDYHKAPLSGSAIFADTLPATGKDIVIPTEK
jgi:hypothetical protein